MMHRYLYLEYLNRASSRDPHFDPSERGQASESFYAGEETPRSRKMIRQLLVFTSFAGSALFFILYFAL